MLLPFAGVSFCRFLGGFDCLFADAGKRFFALRRSGGVFEAFALSFERRFQARLNLRVFFADAGQAGFVFFDVFIAFGNADFVAGCRRRFGFRGIRRSGVCGLAVIYNDSGIVC